MCMECVVLLRELNTLDHTKYQQQLCPKCGMTMRDIGMSDYMLVIV